MLIADGQAAWKSKGQNVDVGDGAHAAAASGRDNRIFGGCEVAVELEISLNERDGVIHSRMSIARLMPCS